MNRGEGTLRKAAPGGRADAPGPGGAVLPRILLQIVHHRRPAEEDAVALVYSLVEVADLLQREFEIILESIGIGERQFNLLAVLYMLDPAHVSSVDAAYYLGVSPSILLLTVRELEAAGLVVRDEDRGHHGAAGIALTQPGRSEAARKLDRYLSGIISIERRLPAAGKRALPAVCDALHRVDTAGRKQLHRP